MALRIVDSITSTFASHQFGVFEPRFKLGGISLESVSPQSFKAYAEA
jgi:hypothetical protein